MSTPDETQRIGNQDDVESAETIRSEANSPNLQDTETFIQPEDENPADTVRGDDDVSRRQTATYDQTKEKSAVDDPIVGHTIDNYEVVSRLGKGGFGAVYKARDVDLDRYAAIKFLHFALEGEYQELFRREAKILANLSKHSSIVQIYNFGEYNNQRYMALEYLDASVQDLLTNKPEGLSMIDALRITRECAEALEYAHSENILHRDIKPANMLIDRKTNRAKLCDFGLAKYYNKGVETASGVIAGSPPYMPIEQIRGEKVDERADIYALGVSLYEMLSGKLPFEGNSHIEIMENVRERRGTPLPKRRPDLSKGVLAIVEKATAAKADDRFQSAAEFKDALDYALNQIEKTGRVESVNFKVSNGTSPVKMAGFVAAAAVILVVAFGVLGGPTEAPTTNGSSGTVVQQQLPPGLAQARAELEAGNYAAAQDAYDAWIAENPDDDEARYGLAFAELLNGDTDDARQTASVMGSLGLQSELQAAIKHFTDAAQAKPDIERAASESETPYPRVLLAEIALNEQDYEKVVEQLANVDTNKLKFNWQRSEANQMLAQAYFNVGNFDAASALFSTLTASQDQSQQRIAEQYLALLKQQTDSVEHDTNRQMIESIRERLEREEAGEDVDFDTWTSRPLRLWIVEPNVKPGSKVPVQEGLVDVFSSWLGEKVVETEGVPLEVVERELISEILQEQQLSSLSADDDSDRVRIGQVLGARLIVYPEFLYFQGDQLKVDVIDTETTKKIPLGRVDVPAPRDADWDAWLAEIADQVREKIEDGYPIRGQLSKVDDGLALNIGTDVGVVKGMKFHVYMTPDHSSEVNGGVVVVSDVRGADQAVVTAEGFTADAVPANGWYVEEIQETEANGTVGE